MNNIVKIVFALVGVLVIGFGLVFSGFVLGRSGWFPQTGQTNVYGIPGYGMMGPRRNFSSGTCGYGIAGRASMMGGSAFGTRESADPLTISEAEGAVLDYIDGLQNDDLTIGEIMIFDNHAYAEIVETSTGIGAMEVLVDPVTLDVFPEYGPNMMWNQAYGMMGGSGDFGPGGMMSGYGNIGMSEGNLSAADAKNMTVSSDEAVELAQQFLDRNVPGAQADEHTDPFYGYYTIHVLRDGEVIDMLSVNGYSGDVFLHTWHGSFIEMSKEH
jgi:hypothetical protein